MNAQNQELISVILQKFDILFSNTDAETVAILNQHLAKMMPQSENPQVKLNVGWGYSKRDFIFDIGLSIFTSPLLVKQVEKTFLSDIDENLFNIPKNISEKLGIFLNLSQDVETLKLIEEGISFAAEDIKMKVKLGFYPPIALAPEMGAFNFSIKTFLKK